VKAKYVGAFDASGKRDLRCIVVAGFVSSVADSLLSKTTVIRS